MTYMYVTYICVWVCMCVWKREREREINICQVYICDIYIYIYIYILYIYIYIYYWKQLLTDVKNVVTSISFQPFFVQTFKIIIDSWKFSMILLYILCDYWVTFMISGSNQQLQQQLEFTLLKPDCHSWWISKMQSGREDTLKERYEIKLF